jgi:hypothetical protein
MAEGLHKTKGLKRKFINYSLPVDILFQSLSLIHNLLKQSYNARNKTNNYQEIMKKANNQVIWPIFDL